MKTGLVLAAATAVLALGACASHPPEQPRHAQADFVTNVPGFGGKVDFVEENGKVTVTTLVKGLAEGSHGFHIHETGDCSKADFTSAGGHFNPGGHAHGAPDGKTRHAGDLGNLVADADRAASGRIVSDAITLGDGANSIIGKAVIIHEKADDFVSQPTGDAGGRLACGVIQRVE